MISLTQATFWIIIASLVSSLYTYCVVSYYHKKKIRRLRDETKNEGY